MQDKNLTLIENAIWYMEDKSLNLELDALDFEILGQLKRDGRKSFTEMADEMNVAVNTIRNRYNRLVQENILHIIGWVDPVLTGFNSYARVMVQVKPKDRVRSVALELLDVKQVTFMAVTSGVYDLEINLMCKDNKELMEVMYQQIHRIEGVHDTHTTIYLEILKWASHDVNNVLAEKSRREQAVESLETDTFFKKKQE